MTVPANTTLSTTVANLTTSSITTDGKLDLTGGTENDEGTVSTSDSTLVITGGTGYTGSIDYIGGKAGKHSAVLGLGLSYDFSDTCAAYFDYTAYIYESLITHSLNLSLGIKF